MKKIVALEVVNEIVLSLIDDEGVSYIVEGSDTSSIDGGTLTEMVTDFTINDGFILWRNQTINLNK